MANFLRTAVEVGVRAWAARDSNPETAVATVRDESWRVLLDWSEPVNDAERCWALMLCDHNSVTNP